VIRRMLILIAAGAVTLAVTASAAAYWSAPGAGTAAGATGGLGQVTDVATSVSGTVASGSFDVIWMPVETPAGVTPTYVVERLAGATVTTVCTTSAASCTLAAIADGSATYRVTATLHAWAGAASSATPAVNVLSAPPAITSGPPAHTALTKPQFVFSDASYGAFRCRLDGGAQTACTSPTSYPGLTPGPHTFEVRAMDAYGALTQAATRSWTIDP